MGAGGAVRGHCMGPAPLVARALARVGVRVDGKWVADAQYCPHIHLMHESWPDLVATLSFPLFDRSMISRVSTGRQSLGASPLVDSKPHVFFQVTYKSRIRTLSECSSRGVSGVTMRSGRLACKIHRSALSAHMHNGQPLEPFITRFGGALRLST